MYKRKIILLIFTIVLSYSAIAQANNTIYRIESQTNSTDAVTYDVNVLILYNDGDYKLMRQKYASKKMMKKNVIFHLENEYGEWQKKEGILYLTNKNGQITKFKYHKNKISLFINENEISDLYWKQI